MKAISVKDLKKVYPLYKSKMGKVKEALSFSGKSYHDDFHALRGISFEVEKGECVGIIGLNGSGKSTLLKILTEVITQSEGEIEINGKVSALLELGAGFNPEYTGMQNIYLNTMLMGYTRKETDGKIAQIIEFADIGDFIYQPVKVYSSGMYVRLAFAIAVTVEPDILIIDEALSVGDVFFQQKCYRKIKEFAGRSTVLIVSHDLNAITKFCRRMIVMDQGQIVFDGESKEAVSCYFGIKQGKYRQEPSQRVREDEVDFKKYKEPDRNMYSGHMDVVISRFFYDVNGQDYAEYCTEGDNIHIWMLTDARRPVEDVIVGYQVRDKYGNEIFGETSLTSHVDSYPLAAGKNLISFTVVWPEVREGDYFVTLGIGEGSEVLNQVEQCWINNALHLIGTTRDKTIFGIFNHEMEDFEIKKL